MLPASGNLMHTQNMARPARRADPGGGKRIRVPYSLCRKGIQAWGNGDGIPKGAKPGTHVLGHQQQNIGTLPRQGAVPA